MMDRVLNRLPFPALAAILVGSALPVPARAEGWRPNADPKRLFPSYEDRLEQLPSQAILPAIKRPWSGPFWADRRGGIAFDWQASRSGWKVAPPSRELVAQMTAEQIAALPAPVKIDIVRGHFEHYDTVARVLADADQSLRRLERSPVLSYSFPDVQRNIARPRIFQRLNPWWRSYYGICVGLAKASVFYDEPRPVTLRSPGPGGVDVRFGVGDLKALAAFYYAAFTTEAGAGIGEVCGERSRAIRDTAEEASERRRTCGRDVNAGALHLALANRVGFQGEALLADFSRGPSVNHHPVFGYRSEITAERLPRAGASPLAVREVRVRTVLEYAGYGPATWDPAPVSEKTRTLRYWLELDPEGRIVGGEYESVGGGRVPDYLWIPEFKPFANGYEVLNALFTRKGTEPESGASGSGNAGS